ncbi:AAA family ATPase [Desulfovibrio inopinatus]|uniref:cytidylate kinase-like family protein n=1 Tax=Desulfovibrio inopinatus TaxID=102109 RepID=UPI000401971A|nr:cytidylate kinase-like family protein [Desulfovibrio inopinatus]
MPIITISRDSSSHGKRIAERVANTLGYSCIGPEIVQQAAQSFDVDQKRLQLAVGRAPRFLDSFGSSKERHLALFRAAFFECMHSDNIVYHGMAGHLFLHDVPNVMKVRIVADLEERIREQMRRKNIGYDEAKALLLRQDQERSKWTKMLFGHDNRDPSLYDIYLNLHNISVDKAVEIIVDAVRISTNGHREIMRKMLADMALAARVEAKLYEVFSDVEATVRDGEAFVKVGASLIQESTAYSKAETAVADIQGLRRMHLGLTTPGSVPF